MADKLCYRIDYVNCADVAGTSYVASADVVWIPTGGRCGSGYLQSADLGYDVFNASEKSVVITVVPASFCPNSGAIDPPPIEPPPVTTGTTAQNPTIVKPQNFSTSDTGASQNVNVPSTTDPKLPSGHVSYSPVQTEYSGTDLGLQSDLYASQTRYYLEEILLSLDLVNPELLEYVYFNRPIPYSLGGWYNIGVRDINDRVQLGDTGELFVNMLDPARYEAYISRIYTASTYPDKGDFGGAIYGTADVCNLQFTATAPLLVIPSVPTVLPDYTSYGLQSPSIVTKNPIPVIDISGGKYKTSFGDVSYYIDNAWKLVNVNHNISLYKPSIAEQSPTQITNPFVCTTPTGNTG